MITKRGLFVELVDKNLLIVAFVTYLEVSFYYIKQLWWIFN